MADVTSVSVGATTVGANFDKFSISQSDAGREFIVSVTADAGTLTNAKLLEAVRYLTTNNYTSGNTDGTSACTVAAVGTADGTAYNPAADTVVYLRLQTTQDFTVTDYNANDALGTTLAVVCEFKPAK